MEWIWKYRPDGQAVFSTPEVGRTFLRCDACGRVVLHYWVCKAVGAPGARAAGCTSARRAFPNGARPGTCSRASWCGSGSCASATGIRACRNGGCPLTPDQMLALTQEAPAANPEPEKRRWLVVVPVFTHVLPAAFYNFLCIFLRAGADVKGHSFVLMNAERQILHMIMNKAVEIVVSQDYAGLIAFRRPTCSTV
jgi:hypothetical protein